MVYRSKGFTLVELMVTLGVAAIALSIAVPSFQTQILNNRSIALGEDFASAVNYARSEAVKRAGRVSLCASKNGTACDGVWTDGFMAFVDTAATDTTTPPVVGLVLRIWEKPDANALISVTSDGNDVTFIRYTSLGTLARVNDEPLVIAAEQKKCKGKAARQINIGLSGLVSVNSVACTAY
ncbi:MAG: GspH/FimT family pseudopilin [Cellvibrio sp.]|uniref:GspH/FimT family pseudopilin n=1 Tax=Cellvibrio sp. TaxID=1965322 RepID=UPI00271B69EF|nr:GspH/FimT family pseudopilin [Cellvibrio sp.]